MAKILLVDDDEFTCRLIKEILEDDGHSLIIANDGKAGIEALRNNAGIDLVIMDIVMPVMNGFEAVKLIRNSSGRETGSSRLFPSATVCLFPVSH